MVELKIQKKYLKNGEKNIDYKIHFSENSLEEINEICDYISKNLKSQNASNRFRNKIISNIESLTRFPKMYARIYKYDKLKREYRKIIIDNYILLYTIDSKNKIVYISHIFYSGKNYLNGLI